MTVALARRLVWEGVVSPDEVNRALYSHVTRRVAFLHALVRIHPDLFDRLETELVPAKNADAAKGVVADRARMSALPEGLCSALLIVPVGDNPATGAVRVIAADASDTHAAAEIAYHLGAPVEVVPAPLRVVLEALGEPISRDAASSTRPLGSMDSEQRLSPAPAAPASPLPAPMASSSPPQASRGSSERPIPLVRVSPEPARAPQTIKGVAPQGVRSGFPAPIVVPPRSPDAVVAEPVIALTRTRSIGSSPKSSEGAPSAPSNPAPSAPHSTAPLHPVAPSAQFVAPSNPEPSSPRSSTVPLKLKLDAPANRPAAPEPPSEDFGITTSPDEVAALLVANLARVAGRVLLFTVRGKVYEGRDTSEEADRVAFRKLVISGDRPSVLSTAIQSGTYFGPIPETAVHEELAHFLADSTGEIAVGGVVVSGRSALLYVLGDMRTAYLATRRGTELAEKAGRALERIVRERKK